MKAPSLSRLLKKGRFRKSGRDLAKFKRLQLKMLRVQQGIWHSRRRAVILFEGFDAAGKGGTIRRITEMLDPRGIHVHAIGPPSEVELGQHYLERFWARLPQPGTLAIFDRSWYGRVLVEKVDKLSPSERIKQAYREIVQFEMDLLDDGIDLIKIFLAIDKNEQLKRFRERLKDPYKQWKLTEADVEARAKWDDYVKAADIMFRKTHTRPAPWHLVPANHKHSARIEALRIVTARFGNHSRWMESHARHREVLTLEAALEALGHKRA